MNYHEAKVIAKQWLDSLNIPLDLKGQQVNVWSYLTEEDQMNPTLFLAKKKQIGVALKKKGARVLGEKDEWTTNQIEIACDVYIEYLKKQLIGLQFKLDEIKDKLMNDLSKSSKTVRFKAMHISSILVNSDLPYITIIKPISRAEIDLYDWKETENLKIALKKKFDNEELIKFFNSLTNKLTNDITETKIIDFESKPESDIYDKPTLPEIKKLRIPTKVDYIAKEIKNKELGRKGEEWVCKFEKERLGRIGRHDLAEKVKWVSNDIGDGMGYDIQSYKSDGSIKYIEVKTTTHSKYTVFYMSKSELEFARENENDFYIYRIFNFGYNIGIYQITGKIENQVELVPINYKVIVNK